MYSGYITQVLEQIAIEKEVLGIFDCFTLTLGLSMMFLRRGVDKRKNNLIVTRPPDKSAYWKIIFFISHPKHMLCVLKKPSQ